MALQEEQTRKTDREMTRVERNTTAWNNTAASVLFDVCNEWGGELDTTGYELKYEPRRHTKAYDKLDWRNCAHQIILRFPTSTGKQSKSKHFTFDDRDATNVTFDEAIKKACDAVKTTMNTMVCERFLFVPGLAGLNGHSHLLEATATLG